MEPPTCTKQKQAPWERNFKARPLTANDWQQHRETSNQLYITDDRDLPQVRETMANSHGFYATERQYKNIIKTWGLEKNIKKDDMLMMINKQVKRKLEGKETEFLFKGRPVEKEKFERFQKRFKPSPESPAPTPYNINYYTPQHSDVGTPIRSLSEKKVDTPRSLDYRSPSIIGDFISEQSTHLGSVLQRSPVTRSAVLPFNSWPSPVNNLQHDHYFHNHPRGQITDGFEAEENRLSQPAINPSVDESVSGWFHSFSKDIDVQDLIHRVDEPYEDTFGVENEVEKSEALQALFESAKQPENVTGTKYQEAQGLVSHLGYEPLAIKLAGAYIANSGTSFTAYLPLYNESLRKVFDQIPDGTSTNDSRYAIAAFEISFQAIERDNRQAADTLLTCAFLHHENIFDDAICRGLGLPQGDPAIRKSIDKLLIYSLVERLDTNDGFSIHPPIHSWLRKRLDSQASRGKMKDALQLIRNLVPPRRDENSRHWMAGRLAQHHLQLCFQYTKQDIRLELSVEEKSDILASVTGIASELGSQGWLNEAGDLQIQVLAMSKKVLGEVHPDTLKSMDNLASTFRGQGQWKEAEDLEIPLLAMRKKVLGEVHPDTLKSMNNLASTFWGQGRWKEAEDLQIPLLTMSKRVLGEAHPNTLTSMNNLASTFRGQGRWKEAEDLEIPLLAMSKKVLGETHPDTLKSMNNLALTFRGQGRCKEAGDLQALRKKLQGETHTPAREK